MAAGRLTSLELVRRYQERIEAMDRSGPRLNSVLEKNPDAAAIAGYPLINVPAGSRFGLPIGITFMGRAWSEPTLIKLAHAYKQASQARRVPEYREGLAGA